NLRHYQAEYQTIVPERLIGFGRRRRSVKDVILAIDQSGSMAASIVYSSVVGAVLGSLPALSTRFIAFDTSVVDLTDELNDPVDLLFGVRLGGGTDMERAVTYCRQLVTRPQDTIMVVITDLYEGGDQAKLLRRFREIVEAGVRLIVLLALSDQGRPAYNHELAARLPALGVPAFACTPTLFPDLLAAALRGGDLRQWVAAHELA
ncbi:MAG: VWA domain-containing protein, partial [Chloroflexi bacterium]|nr:VWA domain-containing protein [Chloroflexota bacterium]